MQTGRTRIHVDVKTLRAVTFLALLIAGVTLWRFHERSRPLPAPEPAPVAVDIEGDVPLPGVHLLRGPDATVMNALKSAGLSLREIKEVLPGEILRQPLKSGQELRVERAGSGSRRVVFGVMGGAAQLVLGRQLDINKASEEELQLVPFMKPVLARAIAERRARKPWDSLDELTEIPGIGSKTVEKWRDYLVVESGQ